MKTYRNQPFIKQEFIKIESWLLLIIVHTTCYDVYMFNPLSVNPEKWSNTLKQIVGNLQTIL